MGWFSADEVISTSANSSVGEQHMTAQTVALCILAAVALGYGALKLFSSYNKNNTERAAANAARLHNLQVNSV